MTFVKQTSCDSHSCFPNSQYNISLLLCFLSLLLPFPGITPHFIGPFQVAQNHIISVSHFSVHSLFLTIYSFTSSLNLEVLEQTIVGHTITGIFISTQLVSFSSWLSGLWQAHTMAGRSPGSIHLLPVFTLQQLFSHKERRGHCASLSFLIPAVCAFSSPPNNGTESCGDFVNGHQGRRKFSKPCQ